MMRSFWKTKQAGELESLKAVEDNLSFTPEEEQYLDTLSGMFKDGVPSDDRLDEMQKKIANIQSVKNEYSHMELKLSQMTSLAKMAGDEEEPEAPEKTKLVPAGIVIMVIGLWQRLLPQYSA